MTTMRTHSVLAAVLAVALGSLASQAQAADYAPSERIVYGGAADPAISRGYSGLLPDCADPAVESRVVHGFAATEREYWGSGLELSPFVRPVEIGYRSWGRSFIPRRFCTAHVVTNDGRKRRVSYNIRENQGFSGVSWGVEWCVSGLDRHHSYAPDCKMARP